MRMQIHKGLDKLPNIKNAVLTIGTYDGVHFGFRSPNAVDMETVYKKSRSEGFGKEVKNRIMLGSFVLSSGYYDAYYSRAQKVRRILKEQIRAIFKDYDFILMPTAPSVAFKIGEKTAMLASREWMATYALRSLLIRLGKYNRHHNVAQLRQPARSSAAM